jgi:hypothetical protein
MSLEVVLRGGLAYQDSNGVGLELFAEALQFSVTTKVAFRGQQSIATSETPIELGSVAAVGWVFLKNLDGTNFVTVKTAASGTVFAKLPPGGICLLYLGSGVTAPVAVADTAAVLLDKLICSQ